MQLAADHEQLAQLCGGAETGVLRLIEAGPRYCYSIGYVVVVIVCEKDVSEDLNADFVGDCEEVGLLRGHCEPRLSRSLQIVVYSVSDEVWRKC